MAGERAMDRPTQREKTHKSSQWKTLKGRSQESQKLSEVAVAGLQGPKGPKRFPGGLTSKTRDSGMPCAWQSRQEPAPGTLSIPEGTPSQEKVD